jgi:RimJ/RimL family protein N-acetyltransferase
MDFHFKKAKPEHIDIIFSWLAEPHMMEFWDNTQEHKDDILNFIHERKQDYFYGTTQYWVGYIDEDPYCFILSDIFESDQDISEVHRAYLSKSGHTIGLDFGIGNTNYLGKGLAAPTLNAFVDFYHNQIDPLADTFFIDPDENNIRAKHVYDKAGFKKVGSFSGTAGAFMGQTTYLMVRKI